MRMTRIKRGVAGTLSYVFCKAGLLRKTLLALGMALGVAIPFSAKAVEYSATIGSAAGSYYYSLTGTGGISYKSFTSSDSWLKTTSTRVSTSGNSWTVNIYYDVTSNTSPSARTATLTGTLGGNPVSIAITQLGNGGGSGKHVMTLYRNNSSGDGAGARRTVTDNEYYTLPTVASLGWTRSGYTFKGWSTSRGGFVSYRDGERIYVSSSLSALYAVWQAPTTQKHVMTLYRNNSSGDGAGARRTVADNAYYTLPTVASLGWTRSGYTFKGWSTSRGGSVSYSDGERIYVSSSLSALYAVWTRNGVDGYDFAATVGSAAESYYYSLTGTGGISYKSFTSSASWLKTTSTRVTTSGNSWTVNIYYSVTANMSSSARTATLTGTLGGSQVRIAITQSGK